MAKRVESALRRLFRRAEIFEAADACRAAVEADVRQRTERCVVRGVGRRRFGACVLSSVILVCVGASPPSICEEPSSALFYFQSISFSFLLSNAAGVRTLCDRSAVASDAVRGCDCYPSMTSAGSLSCCRFCVVSDAVRGWLLCVCLPMEGGVSCCRFFAAVAGCRAEGGCCAVASR